MPLISSRPSWRFRPPCIQKRVSVLLHISCNCFTNSRQFTFHWIPAFLWFQKERQAEYYDLQICVHLQDAIEIANQFLSTTFLLLSQKLLPQISRLATPCPSNTTASLGYTAVKHWISGCYEEGKWCMIWKGSGKLVLASHSSKNCSSSLIPASPIVRTNLRLSRLVSTLLSKRFTLQLSMEARKQSPKARPFTVHIPMANSVLYVQVTVPAA